MNDTAQNTSLIAKIAGFILHPGRIADSIQYRRDKKAEKRMKILVNEAFPYQEDGQGIKRRQYKSHEEYLAHMKTRRKPTEDELGDAFEGRTKIYLEENRRSLDCEAVKGKSVLCLGARDGSEVEAFRRLQAFAVGLDVSYPDENEYVHYGDFHNLPYPDASTDYVYMNTLTHAKEPERVLAEVKRVLKPGTGIFVNDLRYGLEEDAWLEGPSVSFHASHWESRTLITDMICDLGFEMIYNAETHHEKPFQRYVFQRKAA